MEMDFFIGISLVAFSRFVISHFKDFNLNFENISFHLDKAIKYLLNLGKILTNLYTTFYFNFSGLECLIFGKFP